MPEFINSIVLFVIAGALLVSSVLLLTVTARQVSLRGAVLLRRAKKKSQDIITEASKQADSIMAEAQQKHSQELARQQQQVGEYVQQEMQYLQGLAETMNSQIETSVAEVGTSLKKAGDSVTQRLDTVFAEYSKELQGGIATVMQQWDAKMDEALLPLRSELKEDVKAEVVKARKEIDEYKEGQKKLLEERAVDVLERALADILGSKLSLADHVDLVQETLKNAKSDGAFD